MNKIAQYLNEHILGEVTSAESVRKQFSRDGSILSITPEIVVNPRTTNDIRKVARFTWQLAEKGHVMPITMRGAGTDQTGAAIGKGLIINTLAHMNKIIYISLKNRDQFVHVQPGTNFDTLNSTLQSHGLTIPSAPTSMNFSTIGGAVANNAGGILSGKSGLTGNYVSRLEVVLANGDIIETSRINRRELSKKKGLQTFEGEIYRKIDGIIEDNQQTIKDKIADFSDNVGYSGISKVKGRDGSFDLTPLFVGSQGTLGVISEIVMKTEAYSENTSIVVASFADAKLARDTADVISQLQPAVLEVIDGQLFENARSAGKSYPFINSDNDKPLGAVIFVSFNDLNERTQKHNVKKVLKKLSRLETVIFTSDNYSNDELQMVREVSSITSISEHKDESTPPILNGSSIPLDRREEFIIAMDEFAKRHHIELPLQIKWLDGVTYAQPKLNLHSITDKQKTFKLISEYTELIIKFGGNIAAQSGEGRLKSTAAHAQLDKDVIEIYKQIKTVFDPFNTMNPGVKQESDLKTLISMMNPDYSQDEVVKYSPSN